MDMTYAAGAWHVDPDTLRSWVDGTAGPLAGASVEQHIAGCAQCRAAVARIVPAEPLHDVWEDILLEVHAPPSRIERLLLRCGMSPSDALVIASAATFRVAWTAALIGVLGFTLVASVLEGDGGVALFLMAAPLIPVAGVAAVYGPSADPSFEALLAAPYAVIRLALLRTAAVLVTSVPLTVAAGLLLPISAEAALLWLLPAAGFTVAVLTASNWVDPEPAAVVVCLCWIVAVALAGRAGDPMEVLQPWALLGYLVLLVASALVLLHRLRTTEPSWRLR
jgi:hypothetical protein